jgi:hypothetical protein
MRTSQQKTRGLDLVRKSKNKGVTKKLATALNPREKPFFAAKKVSRQNPTKVVFTFRVI